jgi:hypothetical protein
MDLDPDSLQQACDPALLQAFQRCAGRLERIYQELTD